MDRTHGIEQVNYEEQARLEINVARENGVDPRAIEESHRAIATWIHILLTEEEEEVLGDDD